MNKLSIIPAEFGCYRERIPDDLALIGVNLIGPKELYSCALFIDLGKVRYPAAATSREKPAAAFSFARLAAGERQEVSPLCVPEG